MTFPHPHDTASTTIHYDAHPHLAFNIAYQTSYGDEQAYWYSDDGAFLGHQNPNLAGELVGEPTSKIYPDLQDPTAGYSPESGAVHLVSPLQLSLATNRLNHELFAEIHDPYDLDTPMDLCGPEQHFLMPQDYGRAELVSTEVPSFEDATCPASAMYVPTPDHTENEVGCMNGEYMQTGIISYDDAPLPSEPEPFHKPLPPTVVESRCRFPLTRSYTLEGAVTSIASHTSPRSFDNTTQTPPAEQPAAVSTDSRPIEADTAPTSAPTRAKTKRAAQESAAQLPSTPPSTPTIARPLCAKFSTKEPFRDVCGPSSESTSDDQADTETPYERVISGIRAHVPRAPPLKKKKHALACLFCRERKIGCRLPDAAKSDDQSCKQCSKRNLACVFPTECRRGQHKRTPRKAKIEALADATAVATVAAAVASDRIKSDAAVDPIDGRVAKQKNAATVPKLAAHSGAAKTHAGHRRLAPLVCSRP